MVSLLPIITANGGSMKGQHPVTATRPPSTALAISFVLICLSPLDHWTVLETIACTNPEEAHDRHIVRAMRPTAT